MMKNNADKKYFDLVNYIKHNGRKKGDRTGTGTISIFDYGMSFDMSEGFPLLTSKKMYYDGIIHELVWFLRGDTNIKYLVDNNVNIWNGDAYKYYVNNSGNDNVLTEKEFIEKIKNDNNFCLMWGDLGPIYGKQWRDSGGWTEQVLSNVKNEDGYYPFKEVRHKGIDQISNIIDQLLNNPDSRRIIVDAWNVSDMDKMKLPPCHFGFQCYTYEMSENERVYEWCKSINKDISYGEDITHDILDGEGFPKRKLDLKWFQRSVDTALGLPYNIASYGILLHLLASQVNMIPNRLIFSGGDCHIYLDQLDGINEQLSLNETYELPTITINKGATVDNFKFEDVKIDDYNSAKRIKMPLSN
jgi:thymidylate synthase